MAEMSVHQHGSIRILACVAQLNRSIVSAVEKLYLLGMADSDRPEYLAEFACLSPVEAGRVRAKLIERGYIAADGTIVLSALEPK